MLIKAVLVFGFLAGIFSCAQEVRQIDLSGVEQATDYPRGIQSAKYMICDTEESRNAQVAVRVSIESIDPKEIGAKQEISVVLRAENSGHLPVVLPTSADKTVLQAEDGSIHYRAMFPLMAGVPSGGLPIGTFDLYGSTSKPNSVVTLRPGEWITVRGRIRARRWFASEQQAEMDSDLQLYAWPNNAAELQGHCVKQVGGASVRVRFKGIETSH